MKVASPLLVLEKVAESRKRKDTKGAHGQSLLPVRL